MGRVQDGVESSPEFQRALEEACGREYRAWLGGAKRYDSGSVRPSVAQMRRESELMLNPHAREILGYDRLSPKCPRCGEPTRGNKVKGKPFCFRCNLPLPNRRERRRRR